MFMPEKSLKKNIAYIYAKTFAGLVFPLITFPYVSRILQPGGLGKIQFAQSTVDYFVLFAGLGINTYGIRECTKVRNDRAALSLLAGELFTLNLLSVVATYILFIATLILTPKFKDYQILLFIFSSTILFTATGMEWLYSALEENRYITVRSIVFRLASLIFLFTLIRTKDDYIPYAAVTVFISVGPNIFNIAYSRNFIDLRLRPPGALLRHFKPIFVFLPQY